MITEYFEKLFDSNDMQNLNTEAMWDIGGGTGRYALPFAKVTQSVTTTDLFSDMLEHARLNVEKERLAIPTYEKLNWFWDVSL